MTTVKRGCVRWNLIVKQKKKLPDHFPAFESRSRRRNRRRRGGGEEEGGGLEGVGVEGG